MTALTWNTAGTHSESHDYAVQIEYVKPADYAIAGYHSEAGGWYMRFTRGGCHAGAYHETLPQAQGNAARIVNYMRGTHDVFGQVKKA